jgi:large subunit ribosomal protein L10
MVKEQKMKAVEELKKRLESAKVIGVLDLNKLPSKQYQEIHRHVRDNAEFVKVKKSTLLRTIESSTKPNMKEFEKLIPTQPAIIFTEMDPFKFFMTATRQKSVTYAKEGDVADEEILVSAGPTGLMPGPVISEFAKAKIPAGVEDGKIAIKKDTIVARKGDAISKDLANILRKLRIQPIKVGLNIAAVYDHGTIYLKDVLSLAGQGYIDSLAAAHQKAMNLSVAAGYPTSQNVKLLLAKAYRESQALGSRVKAEAPSQAAEQPKQEPTETQKSEQVQTQDSQNGGTS